MIPEHTIFYNKGGEYNGIFAYISKESQQENILSANLVSFSVSKRGSIDHDNLDVILGINNENHNNYFITAGDTENQWFQVDFLKNQVVTFGYFYSAHAKDYFEHFELLGSNNQENWTVLDSRNSEFDNKSNNMKNLYFECNQNTYLPFRYLRLQTHGERGFGQYGVAIYGFEFFGSIRPITICTNHEPEFAFRFILLTLLFIF